MSKETRIIIAGSRNFSDYQLLRKEVLVFVRKHHIYRKTVKIISGTARGADTLGEQFAEEFNLEIKRFPADWDTLGKRAGYIRNEEMAKYAIMNGNRGILIAFWDGKSKGTNNMINLAKKYALEVQIVYFKEAKEWNII